MSLQDEKKILFENKKVILMSIMLALLIISSKLIIPLPLLDFISVQIIIVYMLYPILGKYHSFLTLFIYLLLGIFGLTYKTVILLIFYRKFELFHDILFFSSLVDFLVDSGLTVIITLMMIKLRNYHFNN